VKLVGLLTFEYFSMQKLVFLCHGRNIYPCINWYTIATLAGGLEVNINLLHQNIRDLGVVPDLIGEGGIKGTAVSIRKQIH
jgi:hypothetical protein